MRAVPCHQARRAGATRHLRKNQAPAALVSGPRPAAPLAPTALAARKDVRSHQSLRVPDKHPVVPGKHPMVQDEHPVVQDEHPVVQGEHLLVPEQSLAVSGERPVVSGEHPVVSDEHPVVPDEF